ncbi:MAG: ATP-dependent exodeoxyribonuclease [Cyclobacteriaceae bacterium]|nr:MAG: ATP-dependent exodeoxyribonuclease [Cyclobacteriaceae bacterium]
MSSAAEILASKFPYEPTQDQWRFFEAAEQFVLSADPRITLLLKGYAGTGKTTLVGVLVKVFPSFGFKVKLLAPTGRAAKVLARYSRKSAFTIHKVIYQLRDKNASGGLFKLKKNYSKNTIFIVDEASMISEGSFGNKVLSDLVKYVFQNENNKLLLIGDNAQLPPVGQSTSLALSEEHLNQRYGLSLISLELNQVMRQSLGSGILVNANSIRMEMQNHSPNVKFSLKLPDIFRMSGERLEDGLRYAYDKYGTGDTAVICRSNKNAVYYNRNIRHTLFYFEEELEAGDQIMIVRNNYFYKPDQSPMGFLANGEFAEVRKIVDLEERYGLRFADIEIQLQDDPSNQTLPVKVILDTLHSDHPSLTDDQYKKLMDQVTADYLANSKKSEIREALKNDPYLQALQIKFAYALTCHKSQGGQWKAIFLDKGYVSQAQQDVDFLRWLYTGMTRATDELFLVNFDDSFFGG